MYMYIGYAYWVKGGFYHFQRVAITGGWLSFKIWLLFNSGGSTPATYIVYMYTDRIVWRAKQKSGICVQVIYIELTQAHACIAHAISNYM